MYKKIIILTAAVGFIAAGCSNQGQLGKVSEKTGLPYGGDGYTPLAKYVQPTPFGMKFVEGGTFHMGGSEKDIAYSMDNRERQVTVHSFYMDETEVTNNDWHEFMFYMKRYNAEIPEEDLMPDTLVWFRDLGYNEPFVELYFQNPAFSLYPVVGVTWYQANEYCNWRTQVVNAGGPNPTATAVIDPKNPSGSVPLPNFRLPTEAEWEYASRALYEQEIYPWEGKPMRNAAGRFMANFKRGRGDYAGRSDQGASTLVEGLNDGYMIPAPVRAYWINDFGLYNMAGNVAEWTMDTYRVLAYDDNDDFQPFRRRGELFWEKDADRDDYKYAKDGDPVNNPGNARLSLLYNPVANQKRGLSLKFNPGPVPYEESDFDRIKVYRGGSWKDPAYYLSTGTRRFYNADSCAAHIGFRCAMTRVGSPSLSY